MGLTALAFSLITLSTTPVLPAFSAAETELAIQEVRSHETLDLTQRHGNRAINAGYGDNIRLYLHYLKGDAPQLENNWTKIREPFSFNLTLAPGQVLAFHPAVLPELRNKTVFFADTNLSASDGYRAVDGLWGKGVCDIASFLNMAATKAGLKVTAKTNHDFAPISGVDRRYGTSIYYDPSENLSSQKQNLYLENTRLNPLTIMFSVGETNVEIVVVETVGFTGGKS
ncbi:MAG: VanW family protein [Patescibacteria group bacterium]